MNESVAGISSTLGDSGAALQRAQDKIATMQARAGALDELLQSGVLEDVGGDTDDIQKELDEAGTAADVDNELAALKAQIGPGSSAAGADQRRLRPTASEATGPSGPEQVADGGDAQLDGVLARVAEALAGPVAPVERYALMPYTPFDRGRPARQNR